MGHPILKSVIAASLLAALGAGPASAYVGESFLQVPGVAGGWPGGTYKDWVKFEGQYWENGGMRGRMAGAGGKRTFFSGPAAPKGAGRLSLALDKNSPALKPLMDICQSKTKLAEVKYAESSDLARTNAEIGKRPAEIPAYFEYALKDVAVECPVLAAAPEQGFILKFGEIARLNYQADTVELTPTPAKLIPGPATGESRAFVVTFFASATEANKEQCPVLNAGPDETDYYALLSKEEAAKERARFAGKGGVMNQGVEVQFRGPSKLNVCILPGVVADPGHAGPKTEVTRGFNLDGDDGTGTPAPGVRPHKNYKSPDGRTGIDHQLINVDGCIPGFKEGGLLTSSRNENMRNGDMSILFEVSGIDDPQNDNDVQVGIYFSRDPMAKNATGTQILRNYTFRVSEEPQLTQHFTRVKGRLENGVVTTEPAEEIVIQDGGQLRLNFYKAQLRIEMKPDNTMKAYLGGYQDWRELMNFWAPRGVFEKGMGFRCPGIYQAFKRSADGLKDPISGEFRGISSTYMFDGVKAFIPPMQRKALLAHADTKER